MEAAQHQFTPVRPDLGHNEQIAGRGEEAGGDHRIIGKLVIEDDLDIGGGPHPAIVQQAGVVVIVYKSRGPFT
jgi:hypothetical protein